MWQLVILALFATATTSPSYVVPYGNPSEARVSFSNNLDLRVTSLCIQHSTLDSYFQFVDAKNTCTTQLTGRFMQEMGNAISKRESISNAQILCRIRTQVHECIANISKALEPCLQQEQQTRLIIFRNGTNAFMDYMCFNDGERIDTFYTEGGRECLISTEYEINQCLRSVTSNNKEESDNSISDNEISRPMPSSSSDKQIETECREFYQLQRCIVNSLGKCPNPNTANFADGIMSAVVKVTPCQKYKEVQ